MAFALRVEICIFAACWCCVGMCAFAASWQESVCFVFLWKPFSVPCASFVARSFKMACKQRIMRVGRNSEPVDDDRFNEDKGETSCDAFWWCFARAEHHSRTSSRLSSEWRPFLVSWKEPTVNDIKHLKMCICMRKRKQRLTHVTFTLPTITELRVCMAFNTWLGVMHDLIKHSIYVVRLCFMPFSMLYSTSQFCFREITLCHLVAESNVHAASCQTHASCHLRI